MVRNSVMSRSIAGIVAVLAMVLAVVGALSLLPRADRATGPSVATGCRDFEAAAAGLFDQGDSAALSGRFAPGDHVRLAIDFAGVDFSWALSGVLGYAKKTDVFGSGAIFTKDIDTTIDIKFIPYPRSTTTTLHSGTVSGTGRLDLEIDVTKAGEGAITINKTSRAPSTPPRVAIARCNAEQTARLFRRGDASSKRSPDQRVGRISVSVIRHSAVRVRQVRLRQEKEAGGIRFRRLA